MLECFHRKTYHQVLSTSQLSQGHQILASLSLTYKNRYEAVLLNELDVRRMAGTDPQLTRKSSTPWERLKPVRQDPLESMGFVSKGDTR
jgi:hypothetical protein